MSSSENLNDGTITDVYQNFEFDFESISVTALQNAESPQFFIGGGSKTITKSLFVDFQESLSNSLIFIGSPVSVFSGTSTVGNRIDVVGGRRFNIGDIYFYNISFF